METFKIIVLDPRGSLPPGFPRSLGQRYTVSVVSDEDLLAYEPRVAAVLMVDPHHESDLARRLAGQFPESLLVSIDTQGEGMGNMTISAGGITRTLPLDGAALCEEIELSVPLPPRFEADRVEITELADHSSFVRSGARMREIDAQAKLVAQADIPVLILGESGTGKEVLANYIHAMSNRRNKMFLKVNCAAMPAELLESELFGHEQGAFTGAFKARAGKFEVCEGGTMFLDEIGEMPPVLQAKLLHVLQDGTYSKLGARSALKADVRVIAATNVDVKAAIAAKTFREDLYYRLNGFSFTLPPLRQRPEEIPTFARYFMEQSASKYGKNPREIPDGLMYKLVQYPWPGNLRELQNLMTRFLLIGSEEDLLAELSMLPGDPLATPSAQSAPDGLKQLAKSVKGDAEAAAIAAALNQTRWNRVAAAKLMKISYKALLYKIKQYEIAPGRR